MAPCGRFDLYRWLGHGTVFAIAASIDLYLSRSSFKAELGSAMPTAGGLYWWTFHFASPATRRPLSFLVGYSNTLGLISGLCGVDYAFSLMLLSIVIIANDGNWEPSNGHVYGVFLACLLCHAMLATRFNHIMGKIQTVSVIMNILMIIATILGVILLQFI